MVLSDPGGQPVDGTINWSSGFMPPLYQGTVLRPQEPRILNLDPPPHLRGEPAGAEPRISSPAEPPAPATAPRRGRPGGADQQLRAGRRHADGRQGGARHLAASRPIDPPALRPRSGANARVRHALPDRPAAGRARRPVRPAVPRRPAVGHAQLHPHEPARHLPADRPARGRAGEGPQAARAAGHDDRPLGRRDRPAAGQRGEPERRRPAATTTARASRSGWPAAASRAA